MGFKISNFSNNDNTEIIDELGNFKVLEWKRDLSTSPYYAQREFFSSKMGIRRRQLICDTSKSGIVVQSGAMQWMVGDVQASTGVKGVGDLFGKALRGAASGESAIKPEYVGNGVVVLEPTYKHIVLADLSEFDGSVVLEDGLFLACNNTINHRVVARSSFSSAMAGGEGLFNLSLNGQGVFAIECPCPRDELIEIQIQNDTLKIDGSMAIAWTSGLQFTVERSTKSLIGSAASGEGLVNVYRGTGKVLMTPTINNARPETTE